MLGQTQTKPQGQIASATRPQTLQSTWFSELSKCHVEENEKKKKIAAGNITATHWQVRIQDYMGIVWGSVV